MTDKKMQIAILGGGYSGMICALSLAARNIASDIIEWQDTSKAKFCDDIRSTAISAQSVRFLQENGIWQHLAPIAGPINEIYVADNKASGMIHFELNNEEFGEEKMGYLLENPKFKPALLKQTKNSSLINYIDNTSYKITDHQNDYTEIFIDKPCATKRYDLVIVCDGRKSAIKQKYFEPLITKDYNQQAITFICQHQKRHEGTAVEHFMHQGPFAILPLACQNHSSVVWTIHKNKARALKALPAEEFEYIISQHFGNFLGDIKIVSKVAGYDLSAIMMQRYNNRRMALLADSAHIIHPLAGQGLNLGIKDIACLVEIIEKGYKGAFNADNLAKYHDARFADNYMMFEITDRLNSVFAIDSKIMHASRQLAFRAIEKFPRLKKGIVRYAMGFRHD